jgi:hypothetical protein
MSRIKLSIEPRFLRIPTVWTRHKAVHPDEHGERAEYVFVPEVKQNADPELIEDPWKLRNEFLRMKHSEDAALQFLSKVGVWEAVTHEPQSDLKKTILSDTFGVRDFVGHARPLTVEELWAEQEHWKELFSPQGRAKLRAKFAPRPSSARPWVRADFAFENTLPIHMEWKAGERQYPHAVVQPITGRELLIATVWMDLVRGAKFQVCENPDCGISFSGRQRKHCCESCAHVMAVRAFRKRQKKARKSLR